MLTYHPGFILAAAFVAAEVLGFANAGWADEMCKKAASAKDKTKVTEKGLTKKDRDAGPSAAYLTNQEVEYSINCKDSASNKAFVRKCTTTFTRKDGGATEYQLEMKKDTETEKSSDSFKTNEGKFSCVLTCRKANDLLLDCQLA